MKKNLVVACALVALAVSAPVAAQMQGAGGGYFGIGGLTAHTDNARDFAFVYLPPGSSADTRADGLKVYGGYLFWGPFGVELGYYDLGRYEVRTGATQSDEFEVSAFTVSGVFTTPLGPHFYFSGKLGLAFTSADYRCFSTCGGNFVDTGESNVAGVLGAGLGWRITRNLSLRADYESIGPVRHAVGLITADYHYQALSVSLQADF